MAELLSFVTLAAWSYGGIGFLLALMEWREIGMVDSSEVLLVVLAWAWLLHHYVLFGVAR